MNSFQNFIKIVLSSGVCFLACILLVACAPVPTQTPPTIQTTPATPSAAAPGQISAPAEQTPRLASSHGGTSENQANENLSWTLIDGKQKTLANYPGKVVVLDFWATYCPPCEEEIPHLVELSNKYPKDVQVVGLHVGGAEDKPKIADFVVKYRMVYDLGYPEQELMNFYLQGDDRIPQTLVFDRRGQLVQKFVGFTPAIKADLDKAVQAALLQ